MVDASIYYKSANDYLQNMEQCVLRQKTVVRQQQITEAVRLLILTKGMESVTIGAIAFTVGLSEGAIYRHFASKKEILIRLIRDLESDLLDTLQDGQMNGGTALESLKRILEAHLADVEGSRAISLIIVAETMAFDGIGLGVQVANMLKHYLDGIGRILNHGIEIGELRAELDVVAAASSFFGILQSMAIFRALGNDPIPFDLGYRMWLIFKYGIVLSNTHDLDVGVNDFAIGRMLGADKVLGQQ
jgi:AcrR family transcriptional regulator